MIWVLHKLTVIEGDTVVDSVFHSLWYIFSAQMNQRIIYSFLPISVEVHCTNIVLDAERIIAASSGRIFEITWRVASFLLVATYTGGFVAFLTSNPILLPFKTLNELVDYANEHNYKICLENNTAFAFAVLVRVFALCIKIKSNNFCV